VLFVLSGKFYAYINRFIKIKTKPNNKEELIIKDKKLFEYFFVLKSQKNI